MRGLSQDFHLRHTHGTFYYQRRSTVAERGEVAAAIGRVQAGSTFQCYHGDKVVPLALLEWEPFERMVAEFERWMFALRPGAMWNLLRP